MVGPAAKREAVAHLRNVLQMSERRACTLVAADRKMIRYRSRRPPDVELRTRLRDLANQRRRFGYRRLFILLREQGEPSGVNRIYRLYREEGLSKRKARRRAVGTRTPILVEAKVNARWSLDFVHDQFAQGRRFRILNIVDDVTRECLAAIPDTSISGNVPFDARDGGLRPSRGGGRVEPRDGGWSGGVEVASHLRRSAGSGTRTALDRHNSRPPGAAYFSRRARWQTQMSRSFGCSRARWSSASAANSGSGAGDVVVIPGGT
jgi:hypothetical protein